MHSPEGLEDSPLTRLSGFSFELTKTKKNHLHVDFHFFKPKIGYEHLRVLQETDVILKITE